MRILLLGLVLVSVSATAYLGTVNQNMEAAKAFIKYDNDDWESFEPVDWLYLGHFNGAVAGAASVYNDFNFGYSICYPEGADSDQLNRVTAKYIKEHPEEAAETMAYIIWKSHSEAFGFDADEDCPWHEAWKAATFGDEPDGGSLEEMIY